MRILITLLTLAAVGYGIYWMNGSSPDIKAKMGSLIDIGSFHTLEVRYSANQIMEREKKQLLKSHRHKYLEPILKFYPYLLLEVKYSHSGTKTNEGLILWDLTDGEMVIDTKEWEKTHGFGDLLTADTDRNEFKVLNILAKKGGSCDREGLSKALRVENEILDTWIESCRRKKLIVQSGNRYRLHLENPRLRTVPQTRINERLVTKPYRNAERAHGRYSPSQIERLTRAAFGADFAIRKITDVYLPIYNIAVQNPDGTVHTSYWNALNGKELPQCHFVD